jgi:excisionase family DNA binding protein
MGRTVTVKEAARIMNIHDHTVRRLIKSGKLEAYNTGQKYLINYESIPAFMRKKE